MKECTKCGESKPLEDFYRRALSADGRTSQCASCRRSQSREYVRTNHGQATRKARKLRVQYGLSVERWITLLDSQNRACGICLGPFLSSKDVHVDHDHSCCPGVKSCGKCIRGLLCFGCNVGLGNLGDSVEGLERAKQYLDNPPAMIVLQETILGGTK